MSPAKAYHKNLHIILVSILLITFSSSFIVYGLVQNSYRFNSTGHIKTVGVAVYSDGDCTTPVTEIDWGYLKPGESKSVIVYIKNEGSIAVKLSHLTENWNPESAENYIFFSWDRENQILEANQIIPATLTLSIDENIWGIDSFMFDIVIIGTET